MNDNLKQELQTALAILSRLNVSGDAVDLMAAAKNKIRNVKAALEQPDKDEAKGE